MLGLTFQVPDATKQSIGEKEAQAQPALEWNRTAKEVLISTDIILHPDLPVTTIGKV